MSRAHHASDVDAVAVRKAFNTNILARQELARVHEMLGGSQGASFVRAAARFTDGDYADGLASMVAAVTPHGRCPWPILTYLPNLWKPEFHMFLKPTATLDFAQRVGHEFQYDYSPEPIPPVYTSLLDLVAVTEEAVSLLRPRHRIDVQSFIWVVGDYTEAELPRLEQLRASA